MTAEEHLAKGIECHENGSLKESTYHLRHAARLNHPTGMLLYALACRHGWGMRANQREGYQWLRKAAEFGNLETAVDEDQVKDGKFVDATERRARKAQLALSIYEMGVSHMNGWGIDQDKALALRCFEIAGGEFPSRPVRQGKSFNTMAEWGDIDALAEAGFCYAQGVGCKKDLKKSAKFYRMAEAKGMSMVGNSWYVSHSLHVVGPNAHFLSRIHKSKYQDDKSSVKSDAKTKKARSKSRTRNIFGLRTKEKEATS
jgi:TPR repeat protein